MITLCDFARLVSLAAIGCALSGCERGCVSNVVRTKKGTVTAIPAAIGPAIDCPDGLARCVGGTVEASKLARIPMPCSKTETPEECACPWNAVADCPHGCAAEGVQLAIASDRAAARLCAPDPSRPASRPAPAAIAPPGACETESENEYRCSASLVVSCTSTDGGRSEPRVIAACLRGCAHDGEAVGADETNADGASRILCAP